MSEEMNHNADSETNDSNRENSSENDPSQESQSSRELVVTESEKSSEMKIMQRNSIIKREQGQKCFGTIHIMRYQKITRR